MTDLGGIKKRFGALSRLLDERSRRLVAAAEIVNLIAATTTTKGLKVHAEVDDGIYPAGTKIDDKQLARIRLKRDKFHGDWNYEIHPRRASYG